MLQFQTEKEIEKIYLSEFNQLLWVGFYYASSEERRTSMTIRSPEPEVKIMVEKDPVKTSFEKWAKPGHFSRTLAKGPNTTTWIWNSTC